MMLPRLASVLAVLASSAPALADAPLQLVVRGPLDHAVVRADLERELGTPITEVLDACDAPCLDVSITGDTAVLLYTPAGGAPRLRTLPLGDDPGQWSTLITLLAGTLVRDEARDVLAQLPVIPPASVEVAPRVRPLVDAPRELRAPDDTTHRPFAVGFVPGVSTDLGHVGRVHHWFSLDLLAGVSGGSSGVTLSGVVDVERGAVSGVQLAGVASVARRSDGLQLGGVAAVSGEFHGVQLAGAAAIADRVDGVQIGGATAVARRGAGAQLAGAIVASGGSADLQRAGAAAIAQGDPGVQIAGAAAIAQGDPGVQLAGATAIAQGSVSVQIAGAVNVAERVRGLQLAPFNIARRVDGVQIGVVNVGGSADGFSFGLINIVPGGRTDVEAAIDSDRLGTVMLRHGGRRWHNVYAIGGKHMEDMSMTTGDDDVWMYGFGFGPSWRHGATHVDLDAMSWHVNHGSRHTDELSLLNQLRLSVAQDLGPVAIVAGGALNVYVSTDQESPLFVERREPGAAPESGVSVELWPSAFVGLRL